MTALWIVLGIALIVIALVWQWKYNFNYQTAETPSVPVFFLTAAIGSAGVSIILITILDRVFHV